MKFETTQTDAARKVSKYGVFSGSYFPVFGFGPEKTPYLDTFHADWHGYLSRETSGYEPKLTATLVMQTNRLIKCANHLRETFTLTLVSF